MKIKLILSFFLIVLSFSSFSADQINVYPTHWWIGMKNPKLQLMIHSNQDLPSKKISINHPGILVKSVHQPENKHYLFVDLELSKTVSAGTYLLTLSDGTKISYELKARQNNSQIHQGVRSNDLIYLIMPDRFSNGDPSNDRYADLRDNSSDRANPYARHGGDLIGLQNKMDYLKDLGITAIWMTPILENNMPQIITT